MLRAAPAAVLLRRLGAVLANSAGSADTYELSQPAEHVGTFLSHNWATPRLPKFLVCAVYFRYGWALLCAMVAAGVAFGLSVADMVYTVPGTATEDGREAMRSSVAVLVAGNLGFYLGLFGGLARGTVFLDKVCIHQTDPVLMAQGVGSLGAFIQGSEHLLVVYSGHYLHRLWTVYEWACFICLHPDLAGLTLVPSFLPRLCLIGSAIVFLYLALVTVAATHARALGMDPVMLGAACLLLLGGPAMIGLISVARSWGLHLASAYGRISTFALDDTVCFHEPDRELVYGNIDRFVQVLNLVPEAADRPGRLEGFNEIVRQRSECALRFAVGRAGLPYKYVLIVTMSHGFFGLDSAAQMLHYGFPARSIALSAAVNISMMLFFDPLQLFAVLWLCSRLVHLRQHSLALEAVYLFLLFVTVTLGYLATSTIYQELGTLACTSNAALAAWAAVAVASAAMTRWAYGSAPHGGRAVAPATAGRLPAAAGTEVAASGPPQDGQHVVLVASSTATDEAEGTASDGRGAELPLCAVQADGAIVQLDIVVAAN